MRFRTRLGWAMRAACAPSAYARSERCGFARPSDSCRSSLSFAMKARFWATAGRRRRRLAPAGRRTVSAALRALGRTERRVGHQVAVIVVEVVEVEVVSAMACVLCSFFNTLKKYRHP